MACSAGFKPLPGAFDGAFGACVDFGRCVGFDPGFLLASA